MFCSGSQCGVESKRMGPTVEGKNYVQCVRQRLVIAKVISPDLLQKRKLPVESGSLGASDVNMVKLNESMIQEPLKSIDKLHLDCRFVPHL